MSQIKFIIFVALIALISSKANFILHSHSGSWCDYWTGNGLVNIQVIQKGLSHSENITFNMTVQDYNRNKYNANCTIEQSKEEKGEDSKENEKFESVPRAYCYFDPPYLSADLTYKIDTLKYNNSNTSNYDITIEDDFYIIAQKCASQEKAKNTSNLTLSFRQISTFKQIEDYTIKDNISITPYFFYFIIFHFDILYAA